MIFFYGVNFEQFLCLLAALGEDPTFKAQVAFQQLSSDGGKTINEDNLTKVAQLIIPDLSVCNPCNFAI